MRKKSLRLYLCRFKNNYKPTQTFIKNSQGLKTVIKDSGLFLEAKLLDEVIIKKTIEGKAEKHTELLKPVQNQNHSQNLLNKDLKANLLKLAESIEKYNSKLKTTETNFAGKPAVNATTSSFESPRKTDISQNNKTETTGKLADSNTKLNLETLSKQIESSIARIEVNQSRAIVTQDNPVPVWSIELPIKDKQNIDLLRLDIETDKNPQSQNEIEKTWALHEFQ